MRIPRPIHWGTLWQHKHRAWLILRKVAGPLWKSGRPASTADQDASSSSGDQCPRLLRSDCRFAKPEHRQILRPEISRTQRQYGGSRRRHGLDSAGTRPAFANADKLPCAPECPVRMKNWAQALWATALHPCSSECCAIAHRLPDLTSGPGDLHAWQAAAIGSIYPSMDPECRTVILPDPSHGPSPLAPDR